MLIAQSAGKRDVFFREHPHFYTACAGIVERVCAGRRAHCRFRRIQIIGVLRFGNHFAVRKQSGLRSAVLFVRDSAEGGISQRNRVFKIENRVTFQFADLEFIRLFIPFLEINALFDRRIIH